MHGLPCVTHCCHFGALEWSNQWFLEHFIGSGLMTLAGKILGLPCLRPWDTKFDKAMDVAAHAHVIMVLIREGYIVVAHLGTLVLHATLVQWQETRRSGALSHHTELRAWMKQIKPCLTMVTCSLRGPHCSCGLCCKWLGGISQSRTRGQVSCGSRVASWPFMPLRA